MAKHAHGVEFDCVSNDTATVTIQRWVGKTPGPYIQLKVNQDLIDEWVEKVLLIAAHGRAHNTITIERPRHGFTVTTIE